MNDMNFQRGAAIGSPMDPVTQQPAVAASSSSAGAPILTRYFAIARRRKWVILGAIVSSLIAGLIITLLMTPLYTATATLEIQRESANIIQVDGVEPKSNPVDMEFYQTQYGLLKAQSLAERVATELRLFDNPGFFEMFGAEEAETWFEDGRPVQTASTREQRVRKAGELLLENMVVSPVRLSRLVDIGFTSPDPAFSAKVVDTWAAHFIESNLERRFEATSYARRFLEERLEQLRARLDQSERQLVAYAARQGIINLPASTPAAGEGGSTGERSIVADDLTALNRELSDAIGDRVRAQSRLSSSGGAVSEALENQAISGLRERRAELASEYARLLVQFEPEYPAARAIESQIAQLDRAIAREEGRVQTALQNAYRSAANREGALEQQVDNLKDDLLDLRRRSIQYNIYQRDVDTNRELYDGLLQRYKEIGVAGGVGVNNIAIVDDAKVPRDPSSPNLALNLALALLIGIMVGAGLAVALEQIDEAITDPTAVENALGLPLLGTIPKVEDVSPLDSLQDRKSPVTEAYLSVQTNLAFSTDHGVPKTLAITSTRPAEGKTTTTYAIASTLARGGRRVLLVDADMRSPSAHNLVNLANEEGLSNYLAGGDDLARLIKPTDTKGLSILTAGPQPPSAAELLALDRLELLIKELGPMFDHVVFDAPPVMGLADAPLIASRVEGTIFVIESHGTKTSMARVSISRLQSANVRIMGTVLTKFESKRAQYGYGYDYGYGYGQTPKEA